MTFPPLIYLDHNATTPLSPGVADRMTAVLREEFGNPSSVHHFGQRAKAVIDEARSAVAGWEMTGAGVGVGAWLLVGFTASSRFHMSRPPPRWACVI